jgi:hypothetical protein
MNNRTTRSKTTPTTLTGLNLAIAAHRALSQKTGTKNHLVLEAYEQLFTAVWALPKAKFQTQVDPNPIPIQTQKSQSSSGKAKPFPRKTAYATERRTHLPCDTFASRLQSRIMNQAGA